MSQLAPSASDISNIPTNIDNEIASANAVTDKIDVVMDSSKDIADETLLLGLNAAIEAARAIEVALAIEIALAVEAAKAIEEAKAVEAAKAIEEAKAVETAKVIEVAITGEAGLGLLGLVIGLGVVVQKIRKHLAGSKETVGKIKALTTIIKESIKRPTL